MHVYKELLKIAKRDLEASKTLYKYGSYPQAIFNYHQSLEKTIKSFSLAINIITEKDLQPYNHKPFNIFKKLFENQFQFFRLQLGNTKVIENGNFDKDNIPKFELFLDFADDSLDSAQKSQRKYLTIPEDELVESLELLNKVENELIENLKNVDVDISEREKQEFGDFMFIWFYLGSLSIIVSSAHAKYTRYVFPAEKQTPLKIYTKNHSLIKHYKKIHSLLDNCISNYEKLIDNGYLPFDDDYENPLFFSARKK